jgi:hypothetical protein
MSLFSYLIYSPDRRLSQLTLKSELEQIEDNCQVPNHVLFNFSRSISFHIYERFIDIVYLHQSTPSGPQTKRQDNPYQILSVFVWEDLLFYTDLYSVWLCMPTLFDREPLKLKLATVFPHSREPVPSPDLDKAGRPDVHRGDRGQAAGAGERPAGPAARGARLAAAGLLLPRQGRQAATRLRRRTAPASRRAGGPGSFGPRRLRLLVPQAVQTRDPVQGVRPRVLEEL